MNEDETLVLLLIDACDLCGRKFKALEEFYLLKRVVRGPAGGGAEVINESAFCIREYGGQKVVKI